MTDKVDMSLDEFIKSNRQKFRFSAKKRGRGGAGTGGGGKTGGVRGGRIQKRGGRGGSIRNRGSNFRRGSLFERGGDVNGQWQHDRFEGRRGAAGGVVKLLVSNLDFGVSNSDINELFSEFGRLRSATVNYDRSGRSLGTADVVFERRIDAINAMKQYNGVPLDGRPMEIQITSSEISRGLVSGGMRGRGTRGNRGFGGRGRGGRAGRGGRGRGRGGGGRGGKVSAESLDAELDDYIKSK